MDLTIGLAVPRKYQPIFGPDQLSVWLLKNIFLDVFAESDLAVPRRYQPGLCFFLTVVIDIDPFVPIK